ncbi:histidine kinase [Sphingomonas naphthae]|uniref:Histidine kinase n=1 Tax=Sphingomonas naphthae TaxID=1813468 RepID=A0ABY7TLK2_9SPHN|nr:histidine kinase [Sphingomonas naphthae]WCT73572.1 histidine kinase [Sphingomonas naphthae]
MWRYLVGAVGALLLVTAGALWWKSRAVADTPIGRAPSLLAGAPVADADDPLPPPASEKTREERRFARNDKDKDGKIAREEYLAPRRKAFARLDANGDGRLSFEEWAVKSLTKFDGADADRSGALTPAEFAATRVARKAAAKCACPPAKGEEE